MGQEPDSAQVENRDFQAKQKPANDSRTDFKEDADDKLSRIKAGNNNGKELLFVGLHARRGDYVEFSRKVTI